MPTAPTLTLLTPRDLEILAALDRNPLTVEQLLKLSSIFARPFTEGRRVRERMQALAAARWVRGYRYATSGPGAPAYYTLSPVGYRLLHGEDAPPPPKRAFRPVGVAYQHHTRSLADFIVHAAVCCHRARMTLTRFYRENSLRLDIGDSALWPDCSFGLRLPSGAEFTFHVELDNATERVRSEKDLESWERKIRLYDRLRDTAQERFRVLVVATRGSQRLRHILDAAAQITSNPQRPLFYGITLTEFLAQGEALTAPCFRDHQGRAVPLVWYTEKQHRSTVSATRPGIIRAV